MRTPSITSPLWTDLYELTMMGGYLESGLADRRAVFDLFFRGVPDSGGYAVAAGTEPIIDYVTRLCFSPEEILYLRKLGLFREDFLRRLEGFRFSGEIHAVAEGTPVFPLEPVLRVEAPLFEAQLLESALLNLFNYSTLVATKAARVVHEVGGGRVMEFGMRRAQGPDGSLSATRAAYIGGAGSTSNTLAAMALGIPAAGTHAHSWVMAFNDELAAFRAYAACYPDDTILLLDTYDTLSRGVPNAITVGHEMAAAGHALKGVRLDSGDLAYLSGEVRRALDEAGLPEVQIVASGDLDEWIIHDLIHQGARIDLWGVGTRLVTGGRSPALPGVYKLAAIARDGHVAPTMKLSDNPAKETLPGPKQVWRLYGQDGGMLGDLVALVDEVLPPRGTVCGINPEHEYQYKEYHYAEARPLLVPVVRDGARVVPERSLAEIREHAARELDRLHPTSRRLLNPHVYKVSITERLRDERARLRESL